ncbi:MAG: OmpA family protein [Jannaschia helgolandensis]|uniref:OmpA family protein n=1 Tax=Jannaschia helgolandensis TaxID=188906 RepID=A0A1H7J6M9_9RHOB|nr:OmpA family protein [Jannaschia helgolandensis]SEK70391.1 OmpA family protein [Jannaschia helgolandensis]
MNRLSLSRRFVIGGLGLTALSACTGTQYNRPAGSEIDEGAFGDSTMQNMLVMNGEAPALSHLGTRFAAEVPTTINFAFNSSALDATARAVLDQQAAFISTFPEVRFSVYGHTDKVGSNGYNKRLGLARAKAAVAYLASRGVSLNRLEALVSFGETRPLVPTQSRERANRRAVTEVAGFVGDHPLVLDGKYGQIVYRRYVGGAAGQASASSVATSAAAPAGAGQSAGNSGGGG